jgi:acyl-CoA dehydrogenase
VNLDLSPEDRRFRDEVADFLTASLTPELIAVGRRTTSVFTEPEYSLHWQSLLNARGWAAPAWPREHGGPGWTEIQRHIFQAECAKAGAPNLAPMGLKMVGPCLMGFGTAEQKAHYLPRILSGEDYWCQGYSEPGAGSDLASLQLRAVRDGEDYVLNGSKIWTTHAHRANRMFCLARTRSDGRPQAGITFLLLDMASPGVRVDPIITLAGEHEVNQVFFDDVRVPVANRLGEENQGWTVAKYLLEFERGGSAAPGLTASLDRLRPFACDPAQRRRFAEVEIALTAMDMMERRVLGALAGGGPPGPGSSLLKIQSADGLQSVDALGLDLAGLYVAADQPEARKPGSNVTPIGPEWVLPVMARYLNDRAATIYGGSNEIQRDIIAKLVLGL